MGSLSREGGFFNTTHIDKLYKQWVSFKQIDTNWGSYIYRDVVFKFIEQNHEKQKCLLTENQQKGHKNIFLLKILELLVKIWMLSKYTSQSCVKLISTHLGYYCSYD